jgi:hypothetical protein
MNISIHLTYITCASERISLHKNLNFSRNKILFFSEPIIQSCLKNNCLLHNSTNSLGSKIFKIPFYKQIFSVNIKFR